MMKKILNFLLLIALFATSSCSETAEQVDDIAKSATIALEAVTATESSITFKATITDATEAGYITVATDELSNENLNAEWIKNNAVAIDLAKTDAVTASGLEAETSYTTIAYALGSDNKVVVSSILISHTTPAPADRTIAIVAEALSSDHNSITIKVSPKNAEKVGYLYFKTSEVTDDCFNISSVYTDTYIAEEIKEQEIRIGLLESETEYSIAAYAQNESGDIAMSEILKVATGEALPSVDIEVTEVGSTTSSITFEITPFNNPEACYYWFYKMDEDFEEKDSQTIVSAQESIGTMLPTTITREGLIDNTTYVVYAVAVENGTYAQVMSRIEIKTKELENPDVKAEQLFDSAILKSFGGRSHTFVMENDAYAMEIVLQAEQTFMPYIPTGDYIYDETAGGAEPWTISTVTTKITDKATSKLQIINRANATLAYDKESSTYTLSGEFQTSENIFIPFRFEGPLVYPMTFSTNSGLYYPDDNLLKFTKSSDLYLVNLYLAPGQVVEAGEYSIANGKLLDTSFVTVIDYYDEYVGTLNFKDLSFVVTDQGDSWYTMEGEGLTVDGYYVSLTGSGLNVDLTDTELPDLPEYTLTDVDVLCEYAGGWDPYYYSLEFECEELPTFFLGMSLSEGGNFLPTGYFSYMEEYGQLQYIEIESKEGSSYKFHDEGGVTISKEGDIYTIEFAVKLWMGSDDRVLKAKYVGPVDVYFDDQSSGDSYYYSKVK